MSSPLQRTLFPLTEYYCSKPTSFRNESTQRVGVRVSLMEKKTNDHNRKNLGESIINIVQNGIYS